MSRIRIKVSRLNKRKYHKGFLLFKWVIILFYLSD